MALSDLIVRQAKTAGKLYNLPDLDGLGLVVSPVGGKSWHFRYYWLGKQKRISLGNYPEIGLRDARILRETAPVVWVAALADSSVNLTVRAWVANADYWDVFFEYNERFYKELPKVGINFPFPQMDVHVKND